MTKGSEGRLDDGYNCWGAEGYLCLEYRWVSWLEQRYELENNIREVLWHCLVFWQDALEVLEWLLSARDTYLNIR